MYPSGFLKKAVYITAWAAVNTFIELVAGRVNGYVTAVVGACFGRLCCCDCLCLYRLHYEKPLLVWPLSLACGVACTFIFGLPPLI
jgi:hypothetical protein